MKSTKCTQASYSTCKHATTQNDNNTANYSKKQIIKLHKNLFIHSGS